MNYIAYYFYRVTKALNLPRVEHLYVFFSVTPSFFWVAKVGISQGAETRVKQVSASVSELLKRKVVLWRIPVPVLFARRVEAFLHRLLESRKTPLYWKYSELPGTSGHTEWFGYLNPVFAIIVGVVWWYFGKSSAGIMAVIALLLPLPIDFIIFVTLIFVCQWGAIVCAVWGAVKLFFEL